MDKPLAELSKKKGNTNVRGGTATDTEKIKESGETTMNSYTPINWTI